MSGNLCFPNSLTPLPAWALQRINDLFSGEEVAFCQRLGVWYVPAANEKEWVRVVVQGKSLAVVSSSPNQPNEPVSRGMFKALWRQHFGRNVHPFAIRLIAGVKHIYPSSSDDGDTLWSLGEDGVSFVIGFDLSHKDGVYRWNVHIPVGVDARVKVPPTEYWLNGQESFEGCLIRWMVAGNPYCLLGVTLAEDIRVSAIFGGERRDSLQLDSLRQWRSYRRFYRRILRR